jgi:hypothetical protein
MSLKKEEKETLVVFLSYKTIKKTQKKLKILTIPPKLTRNIPKKKKEKGTLIVFLNKKRNKNEKERKYSPIS